MFNYVSNISSSYAVSSLIKERNCVANLGHRVVIVYTILFRQGATFLPSKVLLLHSIVAFIFGTYYETFITTETILPESFPVFEDLKELLENGYKIVFGIQHVGSIPPEVHFNATFIKHNLSSLLSPDIFVQARGESDGSKFVHAQSMMVSTKTAIVYARNFASIVLDELSTNLSVKCSAVAKLFSFGEKHWIFQYYHMQDYKGNVVLLGQAGILGQLDTSSRKKLHKMLTFDYLCPFRSS